ncbi:MAG: hypothetical protein AAFY11_06935 [Cyanobacteria bacterium J06641_5]
MADYHAQIDELIARADLLAAGAVKVSAIEEAVRVADLHNDLEEGFWLRDELIDAALHGGYPEKALVAFTWCLAQCDRDPDRFPEDLDLLWIYKWFCQELPRFPEITRVQIEETFADMSARYQRAGLSLRAVYQLQTMAAGVMGDGRAAIAYERQWRGSLPDGSNDCPACELHYRLEHWLLVGEDNRVLTAAEPLLREQLCCSEIPHLTLGLILLPLARAGRWQEAARYHLWGYRLVMRNRRYLKTVGEHLIFLVVAQQLKRAVTLMEQHLLWALESREMYGCFYFYRACCLLLRQWRQGDRAELRARLPQKFPGYCADGRYSVEDLSAWFEEMAEHLARRFDSRNGNNFFSRELTALQDLKDLRPEGLFALEL